MICVICICQQEYWEAELSEDAVSDSESPWTGNSVTRHRKGGTTSVENQITEALHGILYPEKGPVSV